MANPDTDVTVYDNTSPVAVGFGTTDLELATGVASRVADDIALNARLGYLINISGNYLRANLGRIRHSW